MRSTSGIQIIGFDHVRAFAALLVFIWHFSHPPYGMVPIDSVPSFFGLSIFHQGYTGVALFMTLSGFLFSLLSFEKEIQLSQFYKNRFLRVFPLLFFWCLYGVAFQNYTAPQVATNLFTLLDNKVPGGGWTVIIEAQFYLLFPFIHPTIENRYRRSGVIGVLTYVAPFLALTWLMRWGTLMETGSAQLIAYWTIFGRIDELLLGALFFYVYRGILSTWSARRSAIALAITLLAFIIFWNWFVIHGGWGNHGVLPSSRRIWIAMPTIEGGFYGFCIALYIGVSREFRGPVARLISYIGAISYSIYLANFFVIPILERFHSRIPFSRIPSFGEYFSWGLLIGFPLICAFSALTYNFIELPFLRRRKQYLTSANTTGVAAVNQE